MAEKKTVKVSRQAVEIARLHVEAARKAGRKPARTTAQVLRRLRPELPPAGWNCRYATPV